MRIAYPMRCGREAFRGQADTREPRTKNGPSSNRIASPESADCRITPEKCVSKCFHGCSRLLHYTFFSRVTRVLVWPQATRVTSTRQYDSTWTVVRFCSIRSLQSIRRCTLSLILDSETGLLTATPVFSRSFVIDQQWRPFVPL